jgi:hypothetical protein
MQADLPADSAAAAAQDHVPLTRWLGEGLRAGLFLNPRVGDAQPRPWQLLVILALVSCLELALARLEIVGPVLFDLRGWLAPQWATSALLMLVWWLLRRGGMTNPAQPSGLVAWFALWLPATVPVNTASQLRGAAQARGLLPDDLAGSPVVAWGLYLLLWVWMIAVALRLAARFRVEPMRLAALALGLVALFGVSAWQFPDRPWQEDEAQSGSPQRPGLVLSQETFETQQTLFRDAVAALVPQRPGVTDVYGLVFAPYADEDVFLRESTMVARLLEERFDARGRVLQLVNNPATTKTLPWATTMNLERAIAALAERMDRDHDVLLVYLTSHGASNYQLAAVHGPLQMEAVSPGELREALDRAGIRHRVIAVSACFSGGWVGPLAGDNTLVMTAADATHTSYGCGRLSELTFFGRAVFDEQLRSGHSFEQAFAAAVPLIRQREIEAHKPDGFSNPQISVGSGIRPVLQALAQRLDALR